ncbi:MAG TPA: CDP-diacylglycerol--serine O-phosphatidyltransferase [Gammaproteobacteria bacterium]|nr:CDP-diacylglycerol--serine O-phosphatidyltransferase [Gammaproteobacteria bacterium]HIL96534.1 CDP-diacylglycerol--serine O-phosphatidyltransferase [Pseudomonadales bacterium]
MDRSDKNSKASEEPAGSQKADVESTVSSLFEVKDGERAGLRRGIYLLPNLITTGALFSGFYAIIAAMSGTLGNAAIAIVIAGFMDALDGRIARMTNTQSEFGVQYDSLSDMVAFGVAPAVLMFSWVLSDLGKIGWMIAFLYMACAALRLARFNTRPDSRVFFGLASPAAAGTIAATAWVWIEYMKVPAEVQYAVPLAFLTAILALLMVSNIRYYSPKQLNMKEGVPFAYMLGIITLFALVFANPPVALLVIGVCYTLSGLIHALVRKRPRRHKQPE